MLAVAASKSTDTRSLIRFSSILIDYSVMLRTLVILTKSESVGDRPVERSSLECGVREPL